MPLKTDNRSVGGRFEVELCEILARNGFWAHNMQQNKAGQPADIIAVKGKFHTLIDCKHIAGNDGFPFEQVRENQRLAMQLFQRRCGELCYFALKLPDETIWMISLERIKTLEVRWKKRITDEEIRTQTWSLEKWMEASSEWGKDV